MDEYQLAFEQSLDDAIEVADEYLSRSEVIAVLEAKLVELKGAWLAGRVCS